MLQTRRSSSDSCKNSPRSAACTLVCFRNTAQYSIEATPKMISPFLPVLTVSECAAGSRNERYSCRSSPHPATFSPFLPVVTGAECAAGRSKERDSCKDSPHPTVCRMARRWKRLASLAAFIGGVVALHYLPAHRSVLCSSASELVLSCTANQGYGIVLQQCFRVVCCPIAYGTGPCYAVLPVTAESKDVRTNPPAALLQVLCACAANR